MFSSNRPPEILFCYAVLPFLCLSFSSCGDDDSARPNVSSPYHWTDEHIVELVYSEYQHPVDFYQEEHYGAHPYYENTVSILRLEESPWIELCANDRDLAFSWSESSAVNSSSYTTVVSERETEKYFEFRRVLLDQPDYVILSRVHKCSYLDRSVYDRFRPSRILGIFNLRPITGAATAELIEYMWSEGLIGNPGDKVFYSQVSESPGAFVQTLLFSHLVAGLDWGMCDEIYLKETRFTVQKESGAITAESDTLRVITGQCH